MVIFYLFYGKTILFQKVCQLLVAAYYTKVVFFGCSLSECISLTKVRYMRKNRSRNIVQKSRNCLCLVARKIPDYKCNSHRVIQARIIKAVFVKRCPVGPAQKSYTPEPLQHWECKIAVQKIGPLGRQNFMIFGYAVLTGCICLEHCVPVIA